MIRFFWRFLVISGLGSQIYIVKSAILIFWVFLSIFLHEITLLAIDIDNIGCLELFFGHFWNWVSLQLNCTSDLTPRLIWMLCKLRWKGNDGKVWCLLSNLKWMIKYCYKSQFYKKMCLLKRNILQRSQLAWGKNVISIFADDIRPHPGIW